jgi:ribonuclease HI
LDPKYDPSPQKANKKNHVERGDTSPKPGEVTIFTDGGSINNPGPGGYGIVMIHDGGETELSGGFRLTTNNRMELMGPIVAIKELSVHNRPITLYSDSSYLVNGITKSWAKSWRKRGWRKSDKSPAINPDLWGELLDLIEKLDITFRWVKGHAGNQYNERCDNLAVTAARKSGLPADRGYEGRE